jgi:AbrB family looped-hinge helix DNA binding protein
LRKFRIGSKGEIFPPKEIRDKPGLIPGTEIDLQIEDSKLIVRPILRVVDLLKEPAQVTMSLEEFHKFRRELGERIESFDWKCDKSDTQDPNHL